MERSAAKYEWGPSVFRQARPESCGPAALAWALFVLGDTVYEEQLVRRTGSHSLADLVTAATERGFDATPFFGDFADLHPASDTAYVLHMRAGHFLACFPTPQGTLAVFEPATGRITMVSADQLAEHWSGYGVAVQLRGSEATAEKMR